jgi:hypothetical protein
MRGNIIQIPQKALPVKVLEVFIHLHIVWIFAFSPGIQVGKEVRANAVRGHIFGLYNVIA